MTTVETICFRPANTRRVKAIYKQLTSPEAERQFEYYRQILLHPYIRPYVPKMIKEHWHLINPYLQRARFLCRRIRSAGVGKRDDAGRFLHFLRARVLPIKTPAQLTKLLYELLEMPDLLAAIQYIFYYLSEPALCTRLVLESCTGGANRDDVRAILQHYRGQFDKLIYIFTGRDPVKEPAEGTLETLQYLEQYYKDPLRSQVLGFHFAQGRERKAAEVVKYYNKQQQTKLRSLGEVVQHLRRARGLNEAGAITILFDLLYPQHKLTIPKTAAHMAKGADELYREMIRLGVKEYILSKKMLPKPRKRPAKKAARNNSRNSK